MIHPFGSNAFWGHRSCPLSAPDKHCWCKVSSLWWVISLKWSQNSKLHPSHIQANVYVSSTAAICPSLVSVVFRWVKHILPKCVSLLKCKGQQWRAPEEGQSEGAPRNDTLRSSVSSHLWSDTTLRPWYPFILEQGGLLNEITFVLRKVTSCAVHCAHFKCSLQNMASGESFECGQLFTIRIWPLKPEIVFFLSYFSVSYAHNPKREATDWKYKIAQFFLWFSFRFPPEAEILKSWFASHCWQNRTKLKGKLFSLRHFCYFPRSFIACILNSVDF